MKKLILSILVLVLISGGMFCGYYCFKGYQLYQKTTETKSIETRVNELRNKDDYVTLDSISDIYIDAVVASEDRRFYDHGAVDYIGLGRAMLTNAITLSFKEGGSTITQQLSKNLCFEFTKSLDRKFAEVFVARKIESNYTKDEILEMYLNITYLGEGCYGIKKAANYYYHIEPSQISSEQAKVLVKTLKAPSVYNPSKIK